MSSLRRTPNEVLLNLALASVVRLYEGEASRLTRLPTIPYSFIPTSPN